MGQDNFGTFSDTLSCNGEIMGFLRNIVFHLKTILEQLCIPNNNAHHFKQTKLKYLHNKHQYSPA